MSQKKGFSLIEAAIVLGIVGLVIGGIWIAASAVQEKNRQSVTVGHVGQIADNVRRVFAGIVVNPLGETLHTQADLLPTIYPADVLSSSAPKNPWGGGYQTSIASDRVVITIAGLSKSTCTNLGPRLWSSFQRQLILDEPFVRTDCCDGNVSTPPQAAIACQEAYDSEGEGNIAIYLHIAR